MKCQKKKESKERKIISPGRLSKIVSDLKKKEKRSGSDFKKKKNQKSKESRRNLTKLNKKSNLLYKKLIEKR